MTLNEDPERPYTWLQLVRGELHLAGETLKPGDAASFDHATLDLQASGDAEFLLFRLN